MPRAPRSLRTGLNSQSVVSGLCQTASSHREQTMTHSVRKAACRFPHTSAPVTSEAKGNKKQLPEQFVCVQLSRTRMQCQRGKKHPPCSTSSGPQTCGQQLPTMSKRARPHPLSSAMGGDSRHCLKEERIPAPQQNPNETQRSLVNLQLGLLSSGTTTLPEEGKDWVSSY